MKKKSIIIYAIILICLASVSFFIMKIINNEVIGIDRDVHLFVISLYNPFLTTLYMVLAKIGGRGGIAVVSIIAILVCIIKYKNKRAALFICTNVILAGVINHAIKGIIQRPRPDYRLMDVSGYSFPSGHSMGAMAFWGLLIIFAYKYIKNKALKWTLITGMSLLILGIGFSRIYLGVHYTSDVLSGFMIALMQLILVSKIGFDFISKENINEHKSPEKGQE